MPPPSTAAFFKCPPRKLVSGRYFILSGYVYCGLSRIVPQASVGHIRFYPAFCSVVISIWDLVPDSMLFERSGLLPGGSSRRGVPCHRRLRTTHEVDRYRCDDTGGNNVPRRVVWPRRSLSARRLPDRRDPGGDREGRWLDS